MKFLVKGSCKPAVFEGTFKKSFISHNPLNTVNTPYFKEKDSFKIHFLLFYF